MHLWNITALAKDLGQDLVSEKAGMYYFLVSSLLILFTTYYAMWWGVVRDWLFYFELIVLSIITIFGCLKAYDSNGSDEGQAFIHRAICPSVPAGVRVNVFSVILGLVLYSAYDKIFTATSFGNPQRAYMLISYTAFVGFNIYFWWLLVKGFERVQLYEQKT